MQAESYEPQIDVAALEATARPHRRRPAFGVIVLVLTVFALIVVKYRTNWLDSLSFDSGASPASSSATEENGAAATPAKSRKGSAKQAHVTTPASVTDEAAPLSLQATLTVPPPLRVEVTYPNGRHQTIQPRDSEVHLSFAGKSAGVLLQQPKDPVYPVAAQQNNVQGAVELMASIAKDGRVVSVRVLSGPDLLANAAVEAVKQWRFKPRQPVDADFVDTPITVNFTISTP